MVDFLPLVISERCVGGWTWVIMENTYKKETGKTSHKKKGEKECLFSPDYYSHQE